MKETVNEGELIDFVKQLDAESGEDGPTDATPYVDLPDEVKQLLSELIDDNKSLSS